MAIQKDGKIVLAGNVMGPAISRIGVARFKSDGSFDSSFSSDGTTSLTVWGINDELASDVVIQSDGKIILSAYSYLRGFYVIRFNSDGDLDNTFVLNGISIIKFNDQYQSASSMSIQIDGKIIIGGIAEKLFDSSGYNFALARLTTDGSIDNSFKFEYNIGADDMANSILVQPDGKIITAGTTNNKLALVRFMGGDILNIENLKISENDISIYPNPLKSYTTFEYTLQKEEIISINLLDIQGRIVKKFICNEKQFPGKYKRTLTMPENLPEGNYLVNISSPNGQMSFKVIK